MVHLVDIATWNIMSCEGLGRSSPDYYNKQGILEPVKASSITRPTKIASPLYAISSLLTTAERTMLTMTSFPALH